MSLIVVHILYLVAITAESMTAALAAGRRSMDWVGVCLLGHHPLVSVEHPLYLVLTAAAALATIAIARVMRRLRALFLLLDAIGLVVFTIIGCGVALTLGEPVIVVIVAGMITGCVGGVLRDLLCNEVPLLVRRELYASVSIVTGGLYVGELHLGLAHDPTMIVAMAAGLTIRLLALRFGWHMPKFVYVEALH